MKPNIFSLFILIISLKVRNIVTQSQDPSTHNGGSIMAMAGENCIAVAVDKRFGSGPQMVNISPRIISTPHPRLIVGFTGLEGDVQSLSQELSIQLSAKIGRHTGFGFETGNENSVDDRKAISPKSLSTLLSHMLYSRRASPYYVEPIIAGLEKVIAEDDTQILGQRKNEEQINTYSRRIKYIPFLCAHDLIGAKSYSSSFVCSGVASKSLYGTAEAMWRPGLSPEELVQTCSRAFLSALERDCLSGYGAVVYLIVEDQGILEYELACRND